MAKLLGVRVLRGPDWQRGDEDGGEGYLGTVTQLLGNHEARVLWDMGEESTCRTGNGGKFDLRVFDTAPAGIRHVNTVCAHCGEKDVGGTLWRCQLCPTCHLCSLCYTDDTHDTGHPFLRVDAPNTPGQPQPKRKASVKVRSIGIHPGAKVIRGKNWEYGDQDGDTTNVYKDSTEKLTPETAPKASPPSLSKQSVTGASTQEEITNVASAAFARPEQQSSSVAEGVEDEELKEGDQVVIKVDKYQLQELQKDCGGCTARMLRCIGKTGEVTGITAGDVVAVTFDGSSRFSYRFSSKALLKTVGKVGQVVKVDRDGDIHVDFHGQRFMYEPQCCMPVAAGTPVDDPFSSSSSIVNIFTGGLSRKGEHMALFRHVRDLVHGHGQSARALFVAIESGDAHLVRELCQQDPSMTEREDQGFTPLIFASFRGRESCAVALLDLGADVNRSASDDYRKTPLSAVAEGKREDMVTLLLSRGARTDYRYGDEQTLAHLCVIRNKVVIMKALVSYGADLNLKDDNDYTPLQLAIMMHRHNVMEVLVQAPQVNIHIRDDRDSDTIQTAVMCNNTR
ncbi:hypothetical protein ACOMHN_045545 [Nucella lapillus]